MLSIFKSNKTATKSSGISEPIAIEWAKTEEDKYFNLLSLKIEEMGLEEMGGIYMIWSAGLKTSIVYIGVTDNLIKSINIAKDNPEILSYHEKGTLGITWSPIQEKYRNRIVSYLNIIMPPLKSSIPELDGGFVQEAPFPVIPPFSL